MTNAHEPKKSGDFKERFFASLEELKHNPNVERFLGSAATSTRDIISYILLIFAIISLFFAPFYGGILVGLIFGFYFSSEILAFIKNLNSWIDEQGMVRSLVASGLLLSLFISAPAIFVGAAIALAIRQIFFSE